MVTSQITFAEFCSVMRRKGACAFCLALCTLGLGLSVRAQEAAPALNIKGPLHSQLNPPHERLPAAGVTRDAASVDQERDRRGGRELRPRSVD